MDVFFATVLVTWTLSGHAGIVDRSDPVADQATCERLAMEMVAKATETYGELPVTIEPHCERWSPPGISI